MKYAFLFPGQGSQTVGMGKDLFDGFDAARRRFTEADAILERELTKIIFTGPSEELTLTKNTQPALFTVEAAITAILAEKGISPSCVAGHSLGEYGALHASGVLSFEDGLKLVAKRGELMAAAGAKRPGTMAAVIGMDKSRIIEVLGEVTSGIVVTANENSPDQTVISGEIPAVEEACDKLKAAGAKRALPLPVSGAFHSPLMQEAADEFSRCLSPVVFSSPKCPVIANVTAKPENDGALLKNLLVRQLTSPVRWVDSMAVLATLDAEVCIEAGPGSVLRGLARKCSDRLNVVAADTVANISFLLEKNYSFGG
jgi:[acyl-carrier-protein] S-malonyltransferase